MKRWVLVLAGLAAVALIAASSANAAPIPWENGEPPIILGVEVEAPCSYCTTLDAQVTGPADGLAFQAASSPEAKGYAGLLNAPCFYNPANGPDTCPQPLYTGPTQQSLAAGWFMPETLTFHVWALREAGTCLPHFTPPYSTERPGCTFRQAVCSGEQTVVLPASVSVSCTITHATTHRRHKTHRRTLRSASSPHRQLRAASVRASRLRAFAAIRVGRAARFLFFRRTAVLLEIRFAALRGFKHGNHASPVLKFSRTEES